MIWNFFRQRKKQKRAIIKCCLTVCRSNEMKHGLEYDGIFSNISGTTEANTSHFVCASYVVVTKRKQT